MIFYPVEVKEFSETVTKFVDVVKKMVNSNVKIRPNGMIKMNAALTKEFSKLWV